MTAYPSVQAEIHQLTKRLALLSEEAESEIRRKLKEARTTVAELEMQLSEITGRPTASQIKARAGFSPLTDEQLELQILFVLGKQGENGLNATAIAKSLNQAPSEIRRWLKAHPSVLKRVGSGPVTKFFLTRIPDSQMPVSVPK